jgi:hypothetical protein
MRQRLPAWKRPGSGCGTATPCAKEASLGKELGRGIVRIRRCSCRGSWAGDRPGPLPVSDPRRGPDLDHRLAKPRHHRATDPDTVALPWPLVRTRLPQGRWEDDTRRRASGDRGGGRQWAVGSRAQRNQGVGGEDFFGGGGFVHGVVEPCAAPPSVSGCARARPHRVGWRMGAASPRHPRPAEAERRADRGSIPEPWRPALRCRSGAGRAPPGPARAFRNGSRTRRPSLRLALVPG